MTGISNGTARFRKNRIYNSISVLLCRQMMTDISLPVPVTPYYPGDYWEMNASMMLVKLDTTANQSWTRIYDSTKLTGIYSIVAMKNNRGFVGHAYPMRDEPLVLFDDQGTILGFPKMPGDDDSLYKIQAVPDGFYASANPGRLHRIIEYHFNNEGYLTGSRSLFNITHRLLSSVLASDETLMTKDQGYSTINASHHF